MILTVRIPEENTEVAKIAIEQGMGVLTKLKSILDYLEEVEEIYAELGDEVKPLTEVYGQHLPYSEY